MHSEFHKRFGFVPLSAGYTVSVRRTRLDVLVPSIPASAGGVTTGILHEGIHPPVTRAIESIIHYLYAACKAEFMIKLLVGLSHTHNSSAYFYSLFLIRSKIRVRIYCLNNYTWLLLLFSLVKNLESVVTQRCWSPRKIRKTK